MLRLLIEDSEGKSQVTQIPVETSDITIGRKAGNSIRLKQRNVSREHARIYQSREDNCLYVEPVHARYGMKVKGEKITGPTPIELGDEIRIGDYRLYVQDDSQPVITREEAMVAEGPQPLPQEKQPRLVAISSNFAGREYPISSTVCIIGRDTQSDICITQASVSGRHAEIRQNANGSFEIRDLGSSNGTKVNGQEVGQTPHELQSGEIIAFGQVVTRFCAPGELWYFNFGASEPNKANSLLVGAFVGILVIAICLAALLVGQALNKPTQTTAPASNSEQEATNERLENNLNLISLIMDCKDQTASGNFDAAQAACDEASDINSNDKRLIVAQDKLRVERNAYDDYKNIENDISNGNCLDALSAISEIEEETYAYKLIGQKDTINRAKLCVEEQLRDSAMDALDNNDISAAESYLEEIRSKGRAHSEIATEVANAINARKAANRPARVPSADKPAKSKPAEAEQPKSSNSDMSLDDICALAVRAKLQKDDNKVCELGKKAAKIGGNNACKGKVGEYISKCK